MTHGPPKGILDWCPGGSVGCENLLQALRRVKPIMHCFGHIHEGSGIEIIDWREHSNDEVLPPDGNTVKNQYLKDTIDNPYPEPVVWNSGHQDQTLENSPDNSPWLISLDLPRIQ